MPSPCRPWQQLTAPSAVSSSVSFTKFSSYNLCAESFSFFIAHNKFLLRGFYSITRFEDLSTIVSSLFFFLWFISWLISASANILNEALEVTETFRVLFIYGVVGQGHVCTLVVTWYVPDLSPSLECHHSRVTGLLVPVSSLVFPWMFFHPCLAVWDEDDSILVIAHSKAKRA